MTTMRPNPLWPESGPPFIPADIWQEEDRHTDVDIIGNPLVGDPLIADGIGDLLLAERFGPVIHRPVPYVEKPRPARPV